MLLGAGLSGLVLLGLAIVLQRRTGVVWAWAFAGLVWSLVVIALVTLLPAQGDPGVVYAEDRLGTCSFDLGGPAPDGFWIFPGGQRLLNVLIFVPPGALMVVAAARWRAGRVLAPLGLGLLAAYSVGIEWTQLELARLDRACDVTDVVDNVAGAVLGAGAGLLLLPVLRPWRARRRATG
ncbi:VanZ like family protein [Nocardioides dokdonensis FR1436]|uniref:VanZ like family protein n=2 Tax=Nocardioides TaxID=1839 RepID=A0A1A9GJ27_9ACTN|nr:VanZ like family protein [Nocardioides dokdonensis FR1436]